MTLFCLVLNTNCFAFTLDKHANYSFMSKCDILSPEELANQENKELDIRSKDCGNMDLSGYDMHHISFDDGTVFPTDTTKLPKNFNATKIMEGQKNPGLGLRALHSRGIDGRGVSIAIIDTQLSPHIEYNDNVVLYEKFLAPDHKNNSGEMHGAAVASIAVGKTVGVAPGTKLYYFAASLTDDWNAGDAGRTSQYYARALNRIIEINKTLPDNEKIVAVSISASPSWSRDSVLWNMALANAKQTGLFVSTTRIAQEYNLHDNGCYRDIDISPDDPIAYSQTMWQLGQNKDMEQQKKTLAFPMDHRTTASPTGNTEYVHYVNGGWSWMKPFEVAVYALAKQVKPNITPEEFFDVALKTGTYSEKCQGILINPEALIEILHKQ